MAEGNPCIMALDEEYFSKLPIDVLENILQKLQPRYANYYKVLYRELLSEEGGKEKEEKIQELIKQFNQTISFSLPAFESTYFEHPDYFNGKSVYLNFNWGLFDAAISKRTREKQLGMIFSQDGKTGTFNIGNIWMKMEDNPERKFVYNIEHTEGKISFWNKFARLIYTLALLHQKTLTLDVIYIRYVDDKEQYYTEQYERTLTDAKKQRGYQSYEHENVKDLVKYIDDIIKLAQDPKGGSYIARLHKKYCN